MLKYVVSAMKNDSLATGPEPAFSEVLRWYLLHSKAPLTLLAHTSLPYDAPVLDVATSQSPLLAEMLVRGYSNLIATDADEPALEGHRAELLPAYAQHVLWVVDDVVAPRRLVHLDPVLLWHDRTLLVNLPLLGQRAAYCRLLNHMIAAKGWVLLGLQVSSAALVRELIEQQARTLAELIGTHYTLRHIFVEQFTTPTGIVAPCAYALFQRDDTSRSGPWQD